MQDSYHTAEEATPFHLFLTNQPDDFAWHQPWLDIVRRVTSCGRRIDRLRVVTVPHGDYTRWGLSVSALNIAAGEDVRWLPRHLVDSVDLPSDDYWLFDEDHVAFTVFKPGGQFAGGAATTDGTIVSYCRSTRDRLWRAAIPHGEYIASTYMTS